MEEPMDRIFTNVASKCARAMGQPVAFIAATLLIFVWAIAGPFVHYSDGWQLTVNTGTTVLTFLAVFLIQNGQNRDGAAIQAKLDEILRALEDAREEFIGIEHLTDAQISAIRDALEQDVKDANGKKGTAKPSVERLLRRY
jgi:low affinity Fe/Cu permease